MKQIRINGHTLNKSLMIEDPDVKRSFQDASGEDRHVRIISDPVRLKAYSKKHPEGMILAGVGVFFFTEPVVVTAGGVRFDRDGNADILVRAGAEEVERQLRVIDAMSDEAQEAIMNIKSDERS